jgi:LysR family transcriptional regulator for bpeEF and oprC
MEQLDLNQIRTFVRIVKAGSFTKAAAQLKQPKSRVSRRLSGLEKDLGVQLIYRTTRQFQLTENGRNYYERCKELIEGLERLAAEMKENTSEISGLIKVTASDDMGVRLLTPILDEFSRQYPLIKFEVFLTQSYLDLVKESVDVALRIGQLKDSSLRVRKVHSLRNILVASPGFVERHRQVDDINQIEQLPFISLGSREYISLIKVSDSKKIKLKTKNIFSCNNPSMMLALTLCGRGYTLVPEFLCWEYLKSGRLVHLHKGYHSEEFLVSLVTPEQKEVPLKIKRFVDFTAKRLKEAFTAGEY